MQFFNQKRGEADIFKTPLAHTMFRMMRGASSSPERGDMVISSRHFALVGAVNGEFRYV